MLPDFEDAIHDLINLNDNEQETKAEADDLTKEGHTICRAFHSRGGVGAQDSFHT